MSKYQLMIVDDYNIPTCNVKKMYVLNYEN